MSVSLSHISYYFCQCDKCGKTAKVDPSREIYNGAQAVRSLGWSFGKDRRVLCDSCRNAHLTDNYSSRRRWR